MKIKVLLFGVLADKAGIDEIEPENIVSLNGLDEYLRSEYPGITGIKYRYSVNQTLVRGNMKLKPGDEVALLPPFAGG